MIWPSVQHRREGLLHDFLTWDREGGRKREREKVVGERGEQRELGDYCQRITFFCVCEETTPIYLKNCIKKEKPNTYFFFFYGLEACGILGPCQGLNPSHWTARELPNCIFFFKQKYFKAFRGLGIKKETQLRPSRSIQSNRGDRSLY